MEHKHHTQFLTILPCILILFTSAQAKCVRSSPRDAARILLSNTPPITCSQQQPSGTCAAPPASSSQSVSSSQGSSSTDHVHDDGDGRSHLRDLLNHADKNGHGIPWIGSRLEDSFGTRSSPANNPELKRICDSTDYPGLCLSSIFPIFNGDHDIVNVLALSIKSTVLQTRNAIQAAMKFADEPGTPEPVASSLRDCNDDYNDALENLQSALDAIPRHDIDTINTMLSAAVTDYGSCNDDFAGKNPIASFDEILSNMAGNCLAIAALMK